PPAPRTGAARVHGDEGDLAFVQVHRRDLDPHGIAKTQSTPAAFAGKFQPKGVEVEVVAAEFGNMHQPVDEDVVKGHEHAELGHARYAPVELLADVVLHEFGLQPLVDVAGRLFGTP